MTSSPSDGEHGVAVTRETVLHFSRPLDSGLSLSSNSVEAFLEGEPLGPGLQLSNDGPGIFLLYEEALEEQTLLDGSLAPFPVMLESDFSISTGSHTEEGGTRQGNTDVNEVFWTFDPPKFPPPPVQERVDRESARGF